MSNTLLIIDDDKNIIEIITELLQDKFDNVVGSSNVDDAIEKIKVENFQLIILDINLVGRNGAEIIKFIIENPNNSNKATPFLILSGIINQVFIAKNKARFSGILLKPFDHDELIQTVEKIINGKNETNDSLNDIPNIECVLPFTIPQLETKVNKVMDGIRKNSKLKDLFKNINFKTDGDNYMLEHVGMLINISTAISIGLEWSTEKTLEKFVYAAYLHDMALTEKPELAKILSLSNLEEMKETLSKEDYKLVYDHPTIAANKIEEIPEIPSDVATMIRQHHENPKERGWPNKIGSSKISPLSSIFIVSHDLTDFIISNPNWTIEKFLLKFKMVYKGPHFTKILNALNNLK